MHAAIEGRVAAIGDAARTLSLSPGSILEEVLPAVAEATGIERAIAYRVDRRPEGDRLDFCFTHGCGPPKRLAEALASFIERAPQPWGLYDPARPAKHERNRALVVYSGDRSTAHLRVPLLAAMAPVFGVAGHDQMRVLVCDGPALLAWLGGFSMDLFTPPQVGRLEAIAALLRPRLVLERQLSDHRVRAAALDASIEAIGRPAFFLGPAGHVVHANAAGLRLLELSPEVRGELRAAVAGASDRFVLHRIAEPGLKPHYLAVDRSTGKGVDARLAMAAARWELSRRQVEVLSCLARGMANKSIAEVLGCAPSTVEVHVSQLLERSGSESRAQLVARFWSELEG
jgi:DNA-binding CsgD family transcriptional regulator/PAS domain-containing protein